MDDTTREKKIDDDLAQFEKIDFGKIERGLAEEIGIELPIEEAVEEAEKDVVTEKPSAVSEEEEQPTIGVSQDGLVAYCTLPPGGVKSLTVEKLQHLITEAGVIYGIDNEALFRMLDGAVPDEAIPIAHGIPATPGKDAEVTFGFTTKAKPGEVLEDGSIDFRERDAVVNMKAGNLLATKVKATGGQPGRDVFGHTLHAEGGKDRRLIAGQNIRVETSEEEEKFYAEIDGSAVLKGDTLQITTIHRVSGDVNFFTGNIDFVGDVSISGSINAGFSVKAGGTIGIGESVESNTKIDAGGDIRVGKGITGRGITVTAGRTVMAKFIQDATVVAKGDVTVGSYIFNASVRAGGRIICHGHGLSNLQRRSAGSIVGGFVFAAKGVETHSLGSEYAKSTRVIVGIDQDTLEQLDKLQKGIEFCVTNLIKIIRTLGIDNLSVESVKYLISRASESRRDLILTMVRKASELKKTRDRFLAERKALEERMQESVKDVVVRVQHTAFNGTEIRIGQVNLKIPETILNARFFIDPKTGSVTWTGGKGEGSRKNESAGREDLTADVE